jgi:small neutral amino acid transporter SnatA (MarC family)
MNGEIVQDNSMQAEIMGSSKTSSDAIQEDAAAAACPLASPLTARVPGLLSLAAVPAAMLVNPFFFGLAGSLLAVISLLLSPVRCRRLGIAGLIGALAGGGLGAFILH